MPSATIRHYFEPYEVSVSVYDDSHCEVSFQNSEDLMQCFYLRLLERPASLDTFYGTFQQNHSEMVVWREVVGYNEMTVQRRMWMRFLTKYDYDDKKEVSARATMETFESAKANFLARQEKIGKSTFKKRTYDLSEIIHKDKGYVPRNSCKTSACGCCCSERLNKFL